MPQPISLSRLLPTRKKVIMSLFIYSCIMGGGLLIGITTQSLASPTQEENLNTSGSAKPQIRRSRTQLDSTPLDPSEIPLPTNKRGFWGTFFFWLGGVVCMYLVGRNVFKEQSHQRRTLRRLRDELGHFFPEFDPVNITKWVSIAADHVFHAWHEGDFESMKSFSTSQFIEHHQALFTESRAIGEQRSVYLDKIIAVHTLGIEWQKQDGVNHPPLGVLLTLRVEAKAIDFSEDADGQLLRGKKKPEQYQYIWRLKHNGNTWTLCEIYESDREITNLNLVPPLPEIADWRRPETES